MLQPNEHISELVKLRVALLALVAWDERNGIYGELPPLMLEAKAALALGSSAAGGDRRVIPFWHGSPWVLGHYLGRGAHAITT